MKKADFITMAEDKFYDALRVSVRQALKFYPKSKFYIYDCGLTDEQARNLKSLSPNVRIEKWQLKYISINRNFSRKFIVLKLLGISWQIIRSFFGGHYENTSLKSFLDLHEFEIKILNKLKVIHCHAHSQDENFIFLDADAFILNPIDEVLKDNFDFGVTLREESEINFSYNKCRLLNSGVLFFLGGVIKNRTVLDEWWSEAENTREAVIEQTSLSRLLLNKNISIFSEAKNYHDLNFLDNLIVKIRILPCSIYNFSKIEEIDVDRDRDRLKILHFKSGRYKTPQFANMAEKMGVLT